MHAARAAPRLAMRSPAAGMRARGGGVVVAALLTPPPPAAASPPAGLRTSARRAAAAVAASSAPHGAGEPAADAPAAAGAAADADAAASARYNLSPSGGGGARAQLTLPTLLTLARVAAVPALLAVYFLPVTWASTACCAIFLLASLTDWLDGYLARKMNLSSAFGAFLDPVADKLMVAAALVLLSTVPPPVLSQAPPWLIPAPAIAIIGREITMSAFREWASAAGGDAHKAVAVNSLGKWKTATQMVAITALLGAGAAGPAAEAVAAAGAVLLWASAALALGSLGVYMQGALPFLLK